MINNDLTKNLEFVWFKGVVEDRNDPKKLGRCRIRCLGFHSEDKSILKTEDLPWAFPIAPITSASMSGLGSTPLGIVEGTWVFGFFMDGSYCQQPVMMGTLGGIPEEVANPEVGFNDPNAKYPKEEMLEEPDTNRLARNEKIEETIVQSKKDNLETMDIATGIGAQDVVTEPEVPYGAEYPFNKVYESESGHIVEVDDTEGMERINIHHKSGTFIEIHPDGTLTVKTAGGYLAWGAGNNDLHLKGTANITVEGDSHVHTLGKSHTRTVGNHSIEVLGNYEVNASGSITLNGGNGGSTIRMDGSSIMENAGSILLN